LITGFSTASKRRHEEILADALELCKCTESEVGLLRTFTFEMS